VNSDQSAQPLRVPRWTAFLLALVVAGLVIWTLYLTYALPSRHVTHDWNVAWAGFDVVVATALAATAVGVLVGAAWLDSVAAAATTLLVTDAWFDIVLAGSWAERREAILLALAAELPLALFCLWIALNANRAIRAVRREPSS
jgi:hypothetical protein